MRLLLILSAFLLVTVANAQNVGIGKPNPTEKLDVSGNVNIDGKIKLNGSAGQPGQTLMVQPDGTQKWISSFGYTKRVSVVPGNTFVVPAGITELLIEVVGGGGGGAKGGGGGAGGYTVAKVKVAAGTIITTTGDPGATGVPASTENGNGMSGSNINVYGAGFNLSAFGGFGAKSTDMGKGGAGSFGGDSLKCSFIFSGGSGSPLIETYGQRSATEYVTMRKQGDGGICAYNPIAISKGGFFSFNTQTLLNITLITSQLSAAEYGCGGAGGNVFLGSEMYWGGYGGQGAVFISY